MKKIITLITTLTIGFSSVAYGSSDYIKQGKPKLDNDPSSIISKTLNSLYENLDNFIKIYTEFESLYESSSTDVKYQFDVESEKWSKENYSKAKKLLEVIEFLYKNGYMNDSTYYEDTRTVEEEPEILNIEDDDNWEIEIMDYVEIEEEEVVEGAIPFQLVAEKPTFNGGDANEFSKWVNQRLVYPEIAKENGVQGRVTLQFTVDKDGSLKNIRVTRGVDPALDKEAVRVVSMSPKWKPGKHGGLIVPVIYTFPVIFQLR